MGVWQKSFPMFGFGWITALIVVAVAVFIEVSAALVFVFQLGPAQIQRYVWDPNVAGVRETWDAVSSEVDPYIGGPRVAGPIPSAEFSDGAPSCGSAYGDSFVLGLDVAEGKGWVEQLSHILGCRVANYAVGNYGTDQAYLRFREASDESPLVLLGINPNNVLDNVNQYDGFLDPTSTGPAALKGRFFFNASHQLEWSSRPQLDANGIVAMLRHPAQTLPRSYFLPDTPDGPVSARFPYTVTLARIALMPRLRNIFLRRAEWSDFYAADHRSGALQLMTAIIKAFVDLANARGKRSLIVMLPGSGSFREYANHGYFEYAPLVAALHAEGIGIFDPGAAMMEALHGRSICEFFVDARPAFAWLTSPVPCGGHYSTFANTVMARLVASELRRRGLSIN